MNQYQYHIEIKNATWDEDENHLRVQLWFTGKTYGNISMALGSKEDVLEIQNVADDLKDFTMRLFEFFTD